jgi:hypothetical protein
MVIESVKGTVTLRNLNPFKHIEVVPLTSGAKPLANPLSIQTATDGGLVPIGEPATPWYLIRIER